MSRLKLFSRAGARAGNVPDPSACPHDTLWKRWRDHRALEASEPIGYVCHRCHAEFLPYRVRDGKLVH